MRPKNRRQTRTWLLRTLMRLSRETYIPQCKISLAIQPLEERQQQRRRCQENRGEDRQRSGEELDRVKHSPREQSEEPAHRTNLDRLKARFPQQIIQPVARVAEIVVRLLVDLPLLRRDQQQSSAGCERT